MKKMLTAFCMGTTLAFLGSGSAFADNYPERPISVMVSYDAGGATDFQSRIVTMVAGEEDLLGEPMVIINKPGAGGRVGWNWFASDAEPDGYTLGVYNLPHFIAQAVDGGVQFSTDSFEPIANWGADPAVIIVGADSPYNTIEELISYAKDNPGKLTVSGAGLLVGHHIAALQIQKAADVVMAYIPTSGGGAAAMKAVIGGTTVAGINNLSDAYRALQAGSVKVLAVADTKRSEAFLPDVPTLAESGIDVDDSSVNFRGLMVPKGTPQDIIDLLAAKVPEMFASETVTKKMEDGGSPMLIMNREEVQAMWANRQAFLEKLLADL